MNKPDYRTLEWSIEQRARIQRFLLELQSFLRKDEVQTILFKKGAYVLRRDIGLLHGIGFSMWRACFLTDETHPIVDSETKKSVRAKAVFDDEMDFFDKLLRDNAINYVQDYKSRHWTVRYYINNAAFRIRRVKQSLERCHIKFDQPNETSFDELYSQFEDDWEKYIGWTEEFKRRPSPSSKQMWDHCAAVLEGLLKGLKAHYNRWQFEEENAGRGIRDSILKGPID